jgi:hypothetical protein
MDNSFMKQEKRAVCKQPLFLLCKQHATQRFITNLLALQACNIDKGDGIPGK